MNHITLQQFLALDMANKIAYFNQLIGVSASTKWEIALLEALKTSNPRLLANFRGLMPFYKQFDGMVKPLEEIKKEQAQQQQPEITDAQELLKVIGISPTIAVKFEGMTVEKLASMSEEELLAIKGVGKKTVKTILEKLPKV